jgi:hypothetical protein
MRTDEERLEDARAGARMLGLALLLAPSGIAFWVLIAWLIFGG